MPPSNLPILALALCLQIVRSYALCFERIHAARFLSANASSRDKKSFSSVLKAFHTEIAPELEPAWITQVNRWVTLALGDNDNDDGQDDGGTNKEENEKAETYSKLNRYARAMDLANDLQHTTSPHELVYGELSIPVLAKILDAVGVQQEERFLDIGSGDGALVMGAQLLYPKHIVCADGLELVPGLVGRSEQHLQELRKILALEAPQHEELLPLLDQIQFATGNIYKPRDDSRLSARLQETTLAVCFATTWSALNNQDEDSSSRTSLGGRELARLSSALMVFPRGARVVIVDGKLRESDGYRWEGDLRVDCPDTAPYSIASLYSRKP